MRLRVFSFNVHKGRAFVSRRRTWKSLHALLARLNPDVIFLQEFLKEKEAQHLLESLADKLWPHHAFGQTATWNGDHYGNAILSRFPLLETHNTDISTSAFERRGLLYGRVEPKAGASLHLFCCHLDLTHRGRAIQLGRLKEVSQRLAPAGTPLLLAGDFNDWQERLHDPLQKALDVREAFAELHGSLAKSSPSLYPIFSLDRIYFRHLRAKDSECHEEGPWYRRSDHLPLTADFFF